MTLSFQGFNSPLSFGSRSSDSSGSITPRANQTRKKQKTRLPDSASSSQTIRPPRKDIYGQQEQVCVEVEIYDSSSPPASPRSWASGIHDAIEGLSLAVEQYFSSPEEDSDEETPNISAALEADESKAPMKKAGKISRTDPNYRYSDDYREIREKMGRIHKFQTIPPEARLVPHYLWNTPEDKLPARFQKAEKQKKN